MSDNTQAPETAPEKKTVTHHIRMAKADDKDMDVAFRMLNLVDAIGRGEIPGDSSDLFDSDSWEDLQNLHHQILEISEESGGIHRILGAANILLNPKNSLIDPEDDCIELHPDLKAKIAAGEEAEALKSRLEKAEGALDRAGYVRNELSGEWKPLVNEATREAHLLRDAVEVLREENDGLRAQVAALEAERDELAKQEPVAWMYDWQATEGLIRDWCTANLAEVSGPVINIRPLYSRPVLHAEQPVNARLLEALKHILNSSLSLPRFAEEQARAAIAAAETRQAEPAGSLTLDKGEVEFLAARVRRLLAKFGVHEPEKDSRFIVGVAGSLIGNLLTNIELKEKAGMVRLSGDDQPAPVIIEGAPCRNALARDGKPYPKSSCQRCGTLLRSGWKCANGVEI